MLNGHQLREKESPFPRPGECQSFGDGRVRDVLFVENAAQFDDMRKKRLSRGDLLLANRVVVGLRDVLHQFRVTTLQLDDSPHGVGVASRRSGEEIVADYNREKDRVTIEETFRRLTELIEELDAEQRRAVEEGLSEDELALFDLLKKEDLGKVARERVKQASRDLLASIRARLKELDRFWEKEQTKADVKIFILDEVYANLPTPPFTPEEKEAVAADVYTHVWQQAVGGEFAMAA